MPVEPEKRSLLVGELRARRARLLEVADQLSDGCREELPDDGGWAAIAGAVEEARGLHVEIELGVEPLRSLIWEATHRRELNEHARWQSDEVRAVFNGFIENVIRELFGPDLADL